MTHVSGTDGHDRLAGWSKSLVDGGDGNDTVDVWSDSVVDSGAGQQLDPGLVPDPGVYGGAGNDQIDIWSDSAADGGNGDDSIGPGPTRSSSAATATIPSCVVRQSGRRRRRQRCDQRVVQ